MPIDIVLPRLNSYKDSFDTTIYSKDIRREVEKFVNLHRQVFQQKVIPFYIKNGEYIYFTLSGYIINKSIALITRQTNFKATDATIVCSKKIEWNMLPTDPKEYEIIFSSLLEVSCNRTFYQTLLPKKIKDIEFLQYWLRDSIILSQLNRLQKSSSVEISLEKMRIWELRTFR